MGEYRSPTVHDTVNNQLSKDQIALLMQAAKMANIAPTDLSPKNPWTLEGKTSLSLRLAIQRIDPAAAQKMMEDAEVPLSLGATAFLQGVGEVTPEIMREIASKRPATAQQMQNERIQEMEKTFLANREKEMEARTAVRAELKEQFEASRIQSLQVAQHHLQRM